MYVFSRVNKELLELLAKLQIEESFACFYYTTLPHEQGKQWSARGSLAGMQQEPAYFPHLRTSRDQRTYFLG